MNKFLIALITLFSTLSYSAINYHGRVIQQSNNLPISSSNVRFNYKIKSGTCVVYEENHDNINMTTSNGYFSQNIGNGTPVFGTFDNAMKTDGSSVNCQAGGSVALSTSSSKTLSIEILDFDGSSYSSSLAVINNLALQEVPMSIASKTLEGKSAAQFIQSSGAVSQASMQSLADGSSTIYVTPSSLSSSISGKMDKSANLSDLSSASSARSNLGLGDLATLSSVSNSEITSLSWSKLIGVPSTFTPSTHSHSISDVSNLQSSLDGKVSTSKLSLNCTAAQTVQYISVSDSYQCQSIAISSSQVSGLGSLASLNSVSDANISSLSGSKLTGGVQVGSVSGTTCTSAGLTRYNASNLEFCDGSSWKLISSYSNSSVPIISETTLYTPTISQPANTTINKASWTRRGDKAYIDGFISWSGVGGGGGLSISLPSGLVIDTAKLHNSIQNNVVGSGQWLDLGTARYVISVTYNTTTSVSFEGNAIGALQASSFANGDTLAYHFEVPIVGWSASTSQVAVYTPPVAAQISGSGGTVTTGSIITGSINYDTASVVSSSRFSCPSTGVYRVHGSLRLASAGTATAYIYKNAVIQSELVGLDNNLGKSFTGSVMCNAGELLDVRPNNTVTFANIVINFEKVN